MPTKNITIDNINPLINYQPVGAWMEGSPADSLYTSYSDSTFTLCTDNGATASFTFNGTAVWIFGAKRPNHGLYNITLDGGAPKSYNGSADNIFQTPLFSQTGLENKQHTVILTNAGLDPIRTNDYLDVDFITWETSIGADDEQVSESTIQDISSSFSYSPQSAWNTNPEFLSSFFGQSGHATTTAGASATFTFSGDAVKVFGTVGPQDAPYTAELDGGSPITYNATKQSNYQQVLLYYADNLGAGQHSVQLTNVPALSGQSLNIDYALVDDVPSVANSASSEHSSRLGGGAVAGIAIGTLTVLGMVASLFFLLFRRHRGKLDTITPEKPGQLVSQPFDLPSASPVAEEGVPMQYPPDLIHHINVDSKSNLLTMRPPMSTVRDGTSRSDYSDVEYTQGPWSTASRSDSYSSRPLPTPRPAPEPPRDMGHIPTQNEMPPPDYSQATTHSLPQMR